MKTELSKENKLILFPNPSSIELYPNMNNKQSCWENEKKKLAYKLKEITLIWRISYEDRNRLISMGITEWDNPYLLNNFFLKGDMIDSKNGFGLKYT